MRVHRKICLLWAPFCFVMTINFVSYHSRNSPTNNLSIPFHASLCPPSSFRRSPSSSWSRPVAKEPPSSRTSSPRRMFSNGPSSNPDPQSTRPTRWPTAPHWTPSCPRLPSTTRHCPPRPSTRARGSRCTTSPWSSTGTSSAGRRSNGDPDGLWRSLGCRIFWETHCQKKELMIDI